MQRCSNVFVYINIFHSWLAHDISRQQEMYFFISCQLLSISYLLGKYDMYPPISTKIKYN